MRRADPLLDRYDENQWLRASMWAARRGPNQIRELACSVPGLRFPLLGCIHTLVAFVEDTVVAYSYVRVTLV